MISHNHMELKEKIKAKCAHLDIPLVGFAPVSRWERPLWNPWIPKDFWPGSIYPEAKTVIVIGLPVSLPVLETAPSIYYHELYKTINTLLDGYTYRIACSLNAEGFPSLFVPRDGYGSIGVLKERPFVFFSHRHAAYLAGLGTFGINNVLLTRKFGPRVRFASVFTAADIAPDDMQPSELCTKCMKCVEICPVQALPGRDYPGGLTDTSSCASRAEALYKRHISPCGLCIRICPVGEDRVLFQRTDMGIYDEGRPEFERYHHAWKHVRKYGGR